MAFNNAPSSLFVIWERKTGNKLICTTIPLLLGLLILLVSPVKFVHPTMHQCIWETITSSSSEPNYVSASSTTLLLLAYQTR